MFCIVSIITLPSTTATKATNNTTRPTIYVDTNNGHDVPSCLMGQGRCKSLHYVLKRSVKGSVSLTIDLSYYKKVLHQFPDCRWKLLKPYALQHSNISFVGIPDNQLAIPCIQFTNFSILAFTGITFLSMPMMRYGNLVEFHTCTLLNDPLPIDNIDGTEIKYFQLKNLVFFHCSFATTHRMHSIKAYIFKSIQQILFLDCSFQVYSDPGNVLYKFQHCNYVIFNNCLFVNNSKVTIHSSRRVFMKQTHYGIEHLIIKSCSFMYNKILPLSGLLQVSVFRLEIFNTVFAHNEITPYQSNNYQALVRLRGTIHVNIANVTFQNNVGLPIWIFNVINKSSLQKFNNVSFINNKGMNAVGVYMIFAPNVEQITVNFTNLSFQGNNYISNYGGGIFIHSSSTLGLNNVINVNNIHFKDELQGISSNSINNMEHWFSNITKTILEIASLTCESEKKN